MAKKIRFPLTMEQGFEARSVEELKEHFSLEKVMMYIANGKLNIWLRDRYEDALADELAKLDPADEHYEEKVCAAFGVTYDANERINMEQLAERERRLTALKEFTTDESILACVDEVAFSQDDLYDLLDEEKTRIYLCGDRFEIPLAKQGICYIGVNQPVAVIRSEKIVDWESIGVTVENVRFDEKYQKVVDELGKYNLSKSDSCDMDADERSGYYVLDDLSYKQSLDTHVFDRKDTPVADLKDYVEYLDMAPIVYGNYAYFVGGKTNESGKYVYHLHKYDIVNEKDYEFQQELGVGWGTVISCGIVSCNNKWLIYLGAKNIQALWYIFNLEDETMRTHRFNQNFGSEYYDRGCRRCCTLVGDLLYIYGNGLYKINLKNMQVSTVLPVNENIQLRGRLMKAGKRLFSIAVEGYYDADIRIYQIDGEKGIAEKSIRIWHGDATIIDSIYYRNHVYYIIKKRKSGERADTYEVQSLDLESEESRQLDQIRGVYYASSEYSRMEISDGVLRYELYEFYTMKDLIKSNAISVE